MYDNYCNIERHNFVVLKNVVLYEPDLREFRKPGRDAEDNVD